MYIADFYNRIIGHYEVPLDHPGRDRTRGRIWRITYQGKSHPKLNLTTPAKAIAELSSPNLTRRHLALTHIVDNQRQQAVPLLKEQSNNHLAAWALYRLGKLTERQLGVLAISKKPLAQIHAMRILNTISDWKPAQRNMVLNALETANPHVKRAAAEALARHPLVANIKPMIDATEKFIRYDSFQVKGKREADDHLIHTLRIALRNQLLAPNAFATIRKFRSNPHRELLMRAALGVATTNAADYLIDQLPNHKGDPSTIIKHSARHASTKGMATLTPIIEKRFATQPTTQASLFKAVQEGIRQRGVKMTPGTYAWGGRLAAQLLSKASDDKLRKSGAEIARDLKLVHVKGSLRELTDKSTTDPEARAAAMDALGVILNTSEFALLVRRILGNPNAPASLKEKTMRASIAHTALHPLLGENLAAAPAKLQIRYARLLSGQGASTLIAAIATGKAPASLLLDSQVKENLPSTLKDQVAQLTQGVQLAKPETAKLITKQLANFQAKNGDPARGLQVFEASCAACHQKNGTGGNIGPQLDGIASRGVERVVEDILDPNRNVDVAFRYSIVQMKNGQALVGLKRREVGKAVVFADLTGKENNHPQGGHR